MNAPEFFAEPRHETIRGERIEIRPLPVKKLSAAARHAAPLLSRLDPNSGPATNMMALIAETDAIIALTALATDRDPDWIGELAADELLRLAAAVVEENADFFIHKMAPAIENIAARINTLATTPGG